MSTVVKARPWARLALVGCLAGVVALGRAAYVGEAVSPLWAACLLVAIVATITLGIFFAQLGLFARPIVAATGTEGRLALTFDDGPEPGATEAVLELLAAHGQRATFFVIGRKAEASRALLERIAREGHAIANHSFEHRHTTPFLPPKILAEELRRAELLLASARPSGATGRWFRAPVGIISPRVARAARLADLTLVSWTASARDGTARATVDSALAKLRPHLRPGAILVLHDGAERSDRKPIAAEVLARLLEEMAAKQLRSVTLDELLS